ncbi:MAG TPA: class I SAM-dependent methyltransferase [Steroidobacteraceae bacterium]|nr:class I SAM-dependent methyltransferase [Steroidobacteraceae bacterium]
MASGSFKDHFSQQARDYAAYRPGYPDALFAQLAAVTVQHQRVWDCATGNGQAAIGLAEHFAHVVATDASVQQLKNRRDHPRVDYCAGLAEAAPLADACCDLVTVAQSVHWFAFERFYAEVRRVLRPRGVLALWTYELLRVRADIDALVDHFYEKVVGPYWPPERHYIEAGYRTIPFPFEELRLPSIVLETHWRFDQVMKYLGTWSAVQRCRDATGSDPLPAVEAQLQPLWGGAEVVCNVRWPLHLRVGRI